MSRGRLRALGREWGLPALFGLAGAGLVIAGAEIGGVVGWLFLGLATCGVFGVVVWAVWSAYHDYWFDDWDDDA